MKNKKDFTINIPAVTLLLVVFGVGFMTLTSFDQVTQASDRDLITGDSVNPYKNSENEGMNQDDKTNLSDTEKDQDKSDINAEYSHNNSESDDYELKTKVERVFDASSTKGDEITGYKWDFGDGTTGTGSKVKHSYIPGNYTVELTVIDSKGQKDSYTKTITVKK